MSDTKKLLILNDGEEVYSILPENIKEDQLFSFLRSHMFKETETEHPEGVSEPHLRLLQKT